MTFKDNILTISRNLFENKSMILITLTYIDILAIGNTHDTFDHYFQWSIESEITSSLLKKILSKVFGKDIELY